MNKTLLLILVIISSLKVNSYNVPPIDSIFKIDTFKINPYYFKKTDILFDSILNKFHKNEYINPLEFNLFNSYFRLDTLKISAMKHSIIKKILNFNDEQVVNVKNVVEILSVKYENNTLIMYVLCSENESINSNIKVKLFKTYDIINLSPNDVYLCTINDPYVFHIFYTYEY